MNKAKKIFVSCLMLLVGITGTWAQTIVTLTESTGEVTVGNGYVLTGTGGANTRVKIAAGATVTLRNVDITNIADYKYWPGIYCTGNATIILEGENKVKGGNPYYPGILIVKNCTLTIQGSGSLHASSNGFGAGIGSRGDENYDSCGNIVINSGTIYAEGGYDCAGIGSAGDDEYEHRCGNITINGGNITAKGDTGIGCGEEGRCGNITINGGTVTAIGISTGIGDGAYGKCGTITIGDGVTKVTATAHYAENCIGNDDHGTITIASNLIDVTNGNTRTIVAPFEVDMSSLPSGQHYTAESGSILTGQPPSLAYIDVAEDAIIILRNVTLSRGISCLGNATVILEGDNNIRLGQNSLRPGIGIPEGKTLTIQGSGSLLADASLVTAAGIGGNQNSKCGNIVIRGGNITAKGGTGCGAAGIGAGGGSGSCGDITITNDIIKVTAVAGSTDAQPIGKGAGAYGQCGTITIGDVLRDGTVGRTRTLVPWREVTIDESDDIVRLEDGDVLTGTHTTGHRYQISAGAWVKFKNANIVKLEYWGNCVTCLGDAIIETEGYYNKVKGSISISSGKTLTFRGNGELTVDNSLDSYRPAIGGNGAESSGDIVIESGTIIAKGGTNAPGIGNFSEDDPERASGTVTILGGYVTATGNGYAPGIGNFGGISSDIYIGPEITKVVVNKGENADKFMGATGENSTTGAVTLAENLASQESGNKLTITPAYHSIEGRTDYTAQHGEVLKGTAGADAHIMIAAGATVTLRDVDITAIPDNNSHQWAGITCLGNATIILEGTNRVTGGYCWYPGIYVPEGKTLTIKGDGSLEASSHSKEYWDCGAGIGGGKNLNCGNIVIDGGIITATGGQYAAGIGSGGTSSCGNITINGGTVTATGGFQAAAIGGGNQGSCGTITIEGTITQITATPGLQTTASATYCNPIGAGAFGTCGEVNISFRLIHEIDDHTLTLTPQHLFDIAEYGNFTAIDGDVITGTWAQATGYNANTHVLRIENNATVTLRDLNITNARCIECLGNATIIVEGTNNILSNSTYTSLKVPMNYTLTIKGDGWLECVNSGNGAAGIGSDRYAACGNIYIQDGVTVVARGTQGGAGIGSGYQGQCGHIELKGTLARVIARVDAMPGDNGNDRAWTIGRGKGGSFIGGTANVSYDTENLDIWDDQILEITQPKVTTFQDGAVLRSTYGLGRLLIADGATVTLRDVDITRRTSGWDYNTNKSGLQCLGNATIILEGDNTVISGHDSYPGIFVPSGKTLTIKGDGALEATAEINESYDHREAPGIGGASRVAGGNIIVEGGSITALYNKDYCARGIGAGYCSTIGTVTIGNGRDLVDFIEDDREIVQPGLVLMPDEDNHDVITTWYNKQALVQVKNLTLQPDRWYVLALPVEVSDIAATFGQYAKVKRLVSSSVSGANLLLNFENADRMENGAPYLVKVTETVDLSTRMISGTVMSIGAIQGSNAVDFIPEFSPVTAVPYDDVPQSIILLTKDNTLLRPSAKPVKVGGLTGYLQLLNLVTYVQYAIINLGNDEDPLEARIYLSGDVNGNNGVDIGDAVCIVNYLVNKTNDVFLAPASDLNGNGSIDIGDAVMIVNILVGKDNDASQK